MIIKESAENYLETILIISKAKGEVRYNSLTRAFPERAEQLFTKAEKFAADKYAHLKQLSELE